MICAACNIENSEGGRFCNNCGAPLGVPSSAYADTITASGPPRATPDGAAQDEVHDQLKGRVIDGRYRIDSLIGIGGMGSVYRATRVLIGDDVAIKILHTERVADPQAAERFRREAQAAARLKHPNAVSIYDFGISSDGLQYLVMELVEGDSLRQLIKQHGVVEPAIAAEITAQTCAALDEAHRQQIVHRDVKPDNIIVNPSPHGLRVKVLDFGIAKLRDDAASHLTQTGSVMGTPHYMSPEQCLGEELDARADIYSMGIVLYEMLCGRVPFNSPVSTAVVVQHVNQPPPPLRSFNTGISPQLEATVFHALQKQREARPPSAGAFARALLAAVQTTGALPASAPGFSSFSQPISALASQPSQDSFHPVHTPSAVTDMPPTVHLSAAQASGATLSVRSTAPTGAVGATRGNSKLFLALGGAALGLLLIATVGALLIWQLNSRKTSDAPAGATGSRPVPPTGMTYVPGGEFVMGSNTGDPLERPSHTVTVKPFFIDVYEVTRQDYAKFVRETGHPAPPGWTNGNYPAGTDRWPATGVSWADANAYARWAGKRLPTEEEWEFAARGADGRRYPWGNDWKASAANAAATAYTRVDEVGARTEGVSPFGAYDMVGNAWEWTASDLSAYSGQLPTTLPSGASVIRGKVIRGGCYLSNAEQATATFRRGWPPSGETYTDTGFRCVKDVTENR